MEIASSLPDGHDMGKYCGGIASTEDGYGENKSGHGQVDEVKGWEADQ